jgi:hypothetical protein
MRFRARNPNPSHPARHTLYLAATGGGKSQALKWNPEIPRKGARVVGWDHAGDHPGLHFYGRQSFIRALKHGIGRGGGFRIFYAGDKDPRAWEWWCEVVWAFLDGDHMTYAIGEELSAVCESTGKATPNAAVLLNEGRKYGLVFHGTSQKPQEVSKTYFDQCPIKFIGQQNSAAMCRRMSMESGATVAEIDALQPMQFFRSDGRKGGAELITVPYRAPAGVIWRD